MKNFCEQCGAKLREGATFCSKCGASTEPQDKKDKEKKTGKKAVTISIAAAVVALLLAVTSVSLIISPEEDSAGEIGIESTEPEPNQEESLKVEKVIEEVNLEAEEAGDTEEIEETVETAETVETEEIDETEEFEETEEELLSKAWNPQDYDSDNLSIIFGSYEQDNNLDNGAEPLEWNVIKEEDGKVLLICKYGIEAMQYNTSENDVTWENCSLRQWLNHDFVDTAFGVEKEDIQLSFLENKDSKLADGGNPTQDYVFLLSEEEFNENMEFDAKTQLSEYASAKADVVYIKGNSLARTWLRTPGAYQNTAAVIDTQGHLEWEGDYNCMAVNAVRPVMWVTKTPEIEAQMAASEELAIGSYVTLGYYEQSTNLDGLEPIEWQILDRKDGKALLISRYILDGCTYGQLREWLNNDFYNTAFDEEKEYIVATNQEYEGFYSNSMKGNVRHVDSVFQLSSAEVEMYFNGNDLKSRAAEATAYAKGFGNWWMRDKTIKDEWGHVDSESIACVNKFGKFVRVSGTNGVRPAIWVDMAVFQSELIVPEEQGYGAIDSVLHLVEGVEGNVTFGSYEQDGNLENGQEPIEWIILDKGDDRMLLVSKYILDAQYYCEINNSTDDIGWEESTLRTWLNNDFYNTAFNDEEKKYIPLSKIYSVWGPDSNPITEETDDYVFILSSGEINAYFDLWAHWDRQVGGVVTAKYQDILKCEQTEYATRQGARKNRWIVRCYKTSGFYISAYNAYGEFELMVPDNPSNGGIRPAIWINLN